VDLGRGRNNFDVRKSREFESQCTFLEQRLAPGQRFKLASLAFRHSPRAPLLSQAQEGDPFSAAAAAANASTTMAPINASVSADTTDAIAGRPTLDDLQGENHYAQLARKYWQDKEKPRKVQPKVVKEELWDHLAQDNFGVGKLLLLEQLQLLEHYLWPGFTEDSSNYHVLLIALMINTKRKESLPSWRKVPKPTQRDDSLTFSFRTPS
jgi:hypothetical protein